ncbi:hypothetical protein O4H61_03285 [Roseovarius aestuarii]|nr:hypothetical protein [Roseovarius aestuarii]
MQVAFPYPVKVRTSIPLLSGLRFTPFTNIDGESFAKPALNGFWRLDLGLLAIDMQGQLALSAFVTQMEAASATCVVPICVQWLPNDETGRMLRASRAAPDFTFDHIGWDGDPFDGYTLSAAASHRDSFIDVTKPALSQIWPGHYISLGDQLYQVTAVSAIGESETEIRLSVMPNIRGDHDVDDVVIVDQLRLNCRMEIGDQIGSGIDVVKAANISLVEAF